MELRLLPLPPAPGADSGESEAEQRQRRGFGHLGVRRDRLGEAAAQHLVAHGGRVRVIPEQIPSLVVKAAHARWGETPVAFVARKTSEVTAERLRKLCRASLASFKQPSEIYFVPFDSLPRSTSGKIQRSEIEQWIVVDRIPRDSFAAEAWE